MTEPIDQHRAWNALAVFTAQSFRDDHSTTMHCDRRRIGNLRSVLRYEPNRINKLRNPVQTV